MNILFWFVGSVFALTGTSTVFGDKYVLLAVAISFFVAAICASIEKVNNDN